MNAGSLSERVTVSSRTVTKVAGEQSEAFADVGTFWCEVTPLRANERTAGGIEGFTEVYRFKFRRNSVTEAITPDYQLTWQGKTFDVQAGPNLSDRTSVEIVAQAVTPRT